MAQVEPFGTMPDGTAVERIALRGGGLTAAVLTYGATVQDLRLDGIGHPLVLGASSLAPYLGGLRYFGAIVGRYANRIAGGRFAIDGRSFQADRNFLGRHCLHGGSLGTAEQVWRVTGLRDDSVDLALEMPDGQMGFPGTLRAEVSYTLTADDALQVALHAETDAPTPCSLSHHSFFNLDDAPDITGHRLRIDAGRYLPVDADLIPTGEIAPVAGGAFDFSSLRPIGDHGYDHNFCLSDRSCEIRPVAWLAGLSGGLTMRVETTAPGLQFYDGGYLADLPGFDGRTYGRHAGLALEAQEWPDAPNRPAFPPAILRPGETFLQRTRYIFGRA
ncbi:MAG: aldose epimerase family protein [Sneathiellaceae bacterium]